jgi:hypothetical protein
MNSLRRSSLFSEREALNLKWEKILSSYTPGTSLYFESQSHIGMGLEAQLRYLKRLKEAHAAPFPPLFSISKDRTNVFVMVYNLLRYIPEDKKLYFCISTNEIIYKKILNMETLSAGFIKKSIVFELHSFFANPDDKGYLFEEFYTFIKNHPSPSVPILTPLCFDYQTNKYGVVFGNFKL